MAFEPIGQVPVRLVLGFMPPESAGPTFVMLGDGHRVKNAPWGSKVLVLPPMRDKALGVHRLRGAGRGFRAVLDVVMAP